MKKIMGLLLMLGLMVSFGGCGDKSIEVCHQFADKNWDPNDYLAWLDSGMSRFSSTVRELPCKDFLEIYNQTGGFGDCPDSEVKQYYRAIGRYDQFVVGWSDLRDRLGNTVQPAQVDSVENFTSVNRDSYEDCRSGNTSSVTGPN